MQNKTINTCHNGYIFSIYALLTVSEAECPSMLYAGENKQQNATASLSFLWDSHRHVFVYI